MENKKLWTKDFLFLNLATLLLSTGFYFLMPTLPLYMADVLRSNRGQVGYIMAAFTLSALLTRPIAGYWIDRVGRKWVLVISYLLFSLTLGIYPLAASFPLLLLLRCCHVLLWGAYTLNGDTAVVDLVPSVKRGQGIGIYGLFMTLALALGPVIALSIMGKDRYDLMFLSAMVVALFGFGLLMRVNFPHFERRDGGPFTLADVAESSVLPLAIVQLLFGVTYGGTITFITLYAKELGIMEAGPFFLINALGITLSRLGSGQVFDRQGPKVLLSSCLALLIGGFAILALVKNHYGFYFAAFLIGFGSGVIMPTLQAMANNIVGQNRRGSANATIITGFDLGIGLGAVLLGYLSDLIGLGNTYLVCGLIILLSLIYFLAKVNPYYHEQRSLED